MSFTRGPHRVRLLSAVAAAGLVLGATSLVLPSRPAAQTASPIKTVFVIVFENYDWAQVKGNAAAPYINKTLLPQASRAENYNTPPGLHPSTPNYWWMEAGQDFGLRGLTDYTPAKYPLSTASHLVNQLESAGVSWRSYHENIDGTGCPLADAGLYTVHHNPFVFFTDVTNNGDPTASRCIQHVRPYTELAADLAQNTVARYNYIVPNLCNDMHDCGIAAGDTWLANNLPAILASRAYLDGGAVIVTWDEGANATSDGPIGMIVLSPAGKGNGYFNSIRYTHSSFLLTMQEIFNVRPLLGDAPNATDLSDLFASFPAVTPSTPAPADKATAVGTSPTLKWSSSGSSDEVYFGTANPPPRVATGVAGHAYVPSALTPSTAYYWQVVSNTTAGRTAGPVWSFTTGTSASTVPWANVDVGAVGVAGSTTYGASDFTVRGAGADIWGTADGFQFVYQPLDGDGAIVARVTSLQNTNVYAKAGVMIRETLSAGSAHVVLDVKPAGGIEFMQRSVAGGSTSYLGGTTLAFPVWLRLRRSGGTITAAVSSDGAGWTSIGSTSAPMGSSVLIGMPTTSHTTSALTTATFDNVTVTTAAQAPSVPASPSPADAAVGVGTSPTLFWNASGATSYDLAFGTTTPPALAATALSSASYSPGALASGTVYYWRVTARNATGATTGPVWSFTTAAAAPPPPPTAPASPSPSDGATGVATGATLTWTASNATSYDVAFGTANPPPQTATGLTSASYPPTGMTAGTTYYWQVTARNATGATAGPVWSFATASSPPQPSGLPAPWGNVDVGTVSLAGSASYSNGVFSVAGSGNDIWGSSDAFQFVYQPLSGNGQIVANVTGIQYTNKFAKAGVMLRLSLSASSPHVLLDVRPTGAVELLSRAAAGAGTKLLANASQRVPAWLKLTRSGATITAYVSGDGVTWRRVGATTLAMPDPIYVGLAVCSHNTSQLNRSTFASVTVGPY